MAQFLTADGQVTIPAEIRARLGLKPGDAVEFAVNDNGEVLLFTPTRSQSRAAQYEERLKGLAGAIDLDGKSTEDYVRWLRGEDA